MQETARARQIEYQSGGVWVKTGTNQLLAFDVSRYGSDSFQAIKNDALGLITEKVSAEEGVVDDETRVKMQLTPPEHVLFETESGFLVSPENLEDEKDVLETISDWRHGVDLAAISEVKRQFFQSKVGDMFFWYSARAESWEDEIVRRYNGEYGYFYAGRVESAGSLRKLVIHDFKNDLNQEASNLFLSNIPGSLHHTPNEDLDGIALYKSMSTIGKVESGSAQDIDDAQVWIRLSEAKEEAEKNPDIFNLPVEVILTLQDVELQERLKEGAATEIANWISQEIKKGIPTFRIQSQVRQRFIDATKRQFRNYVFSKDSEVDTAGGRVEKDDLKNYVSLYSGSSGNFCGEWGGGGGMMIDGPFGARFGYLNGYKQENIVTLNGEFYLRYNGDLIKGTRCFNCGFVTICGDRCANPQCHLLLALQQVTQLTPQAQKDYTGEVQKAA